MDRALQFALAVVCAVLFLGIAGGAGASINDLPGFSDASGPSEMRVAELERLESGCAEDVGGFAGTSMGEDIAKTSSIPAAGPDAALGASVERTSPAGADLSTFRLRVQTHGGSPANGSCEYEIAYRVRLAFDEGASGGLMPDENGMRVLHLENGRYAGCSASVTGGLDDECHRFVDRPKRTWANATDAI